MSNIDHFRAHPLRSKLDKPDPASAVAAFNDAFGNAATDLIAWTADAL